MDIIKLCRIVPKHLTFPITASLISLLFQCVLKSTNTFQTSPPFVLHASTSKGDVVQDIILEANKGVVIITAIESNPSRYFPMSATQSQDSFDKKSPETNQCEKDSLPQHFIPLKNMPRTYKIVIDTLNANNELSIVRQIHSHLKKKPGTFVSSIDVDHLHYTIKTICKPSPKKSPSRYSESKTQFWSGPEHEKNLRQLLLLTPKIPVENPTITTTQIEFCRLTRWNCLDSSTVCDPAHRVHPL